ncbi:hypothetical protein [Saccharothrix ecbatanensis]|uniref:hypothetical protein n=1 Tax=Saccharothrix ecbatanensis TaxID=1105145 RepID=UPI001FEBF176|nr:hypothetical protein [Saccharothrix ecbatanensis]
MFRATDTEAAPWTVVKSNDKKRARLEAMRSVLARVDHDDRDVEVVGEGRPPRCWGRGRTRRRPARSPSRPPTTPTTAWASTPDSAPGTTRQDMLVTHANATSTAGLRPADVGGPAATCTGPVQGKRSPVAARQDQTRTPRPLRSSPSNAGRHRIGPRSTT